MISIDSLNWDGWLAAYHQNFYKFHGFSWKILYRLFLVRMEIEEWVFLMLTLKLPTTPELILG